MNRVERTITVFTRGPVSVRHAIRLIVVATVVTTLAGGFLVWIFDRSDFGGLGDAMWWSLQTVTTVGYGDVTPTKPVGRIIGAAFLLYSVAFLAILTAAITTTFIERARRDRAAREGREPDGRAALLERLDDIVVRLDRLEQSLDRTAGSNRE
jgi:voltage-gated potassium channel